MKLDTESARSGAGSPVSVDPAESRVKLESPLAKTESTSEAYVKDVQGGLSDLWILVAAILTTARKQRGRQYSEGGGNRGVFLRT